MKLDEIRLDKSDFTIEYDCINPQQAPEPWGDFSRVEELFAKLEKNANNYEVVRMNLNDGSDSYWGKPVVIITLKYVGPIVKKKKYKTSICNLEVTEEELELINHFLLRSIKECDASSYNNIKDTFRKFIRNVIASFKEIK